MRLVVLLSAFFIMLSCEQKDCCTVIELDISVQYTNDKGEDLLNPATENHFDKSKIKILYLVNGEAKEVIRSNQDNPKMFSVSESSNGTKKSYTLLLYVNDRATDNIKTTYLQLSENDTDTITHTLADSKNNEIIKEVWYNGMPSTSQYERDFKVVKNGEK